MSAASESTGRRMTSLSVEKISGTWITKSIFAWGDPAYVALVNFTALA
jgi:hypothetical protein